jgi:hypothetical protein
VVVVVVDLLWLLDVVVVEEGEATKHLLCLLAILNLTGCMQPAGPCLLHVVELLWWWEKLWCFVNLVHGPAVLAPGVPEGPAPLPRPLPAGTVFPTVVGRSVPAGGVVLGAIVTVGCCTGGYCDFLMFGC